MAIRHRFFCTLLLVSTIGGTAYSRTLLVDESFSHRKLGKSLTCFIDSRGDRSVDEINSLPSSFFFKITSSTPGFGYSSATYWFRLDIENISGSRQPLFIEYNYPVIDSVVLYRSWLPWGKSMAAGDTVLFESWPAKFRALLFPVTIPVGKNFVYFRVRSRGAVTVPLHAWSVSAFENKKEKEGIFLWLYYGIMLALALYNFFIFLSARDRSYLFLSLFTASQSFYSMVHNGLAFQYLWPSCSWWANRAHPFFMLLILLTATLFLKSFLMTKKETPRFNVFITGILVFSVVQLAVMFFLPYRPVTMLSTFSAITGAVTFFLYSVYMVVKGSRQALFFLSAWVLFILGAAASGLQAYGIVSNNFVGMWGQQIGITLLVFMLSFGIADKLKTMMNSLIKAKETIRHQYAEIEANYSEMEAMNEELMLTQNELVNANDLLRDEMERASAILSSIDEAVIAIDKEGKVTSANATAGLFFEEDAASLEGKDLNSLAELKNRISGKTIGDFSRLVLESGSFPFRNVPIVLNTGKGNSFVVEVNGTRLLRFDGSVVGTVMVMRDIRARLRLEEEIMKMRRIESVGILAGGIAHDFNNLLTAIMAGASMARLKIIDGDKELDEYLSQVETAGKRAAALTKQLLTFSKGGEPVKKTVSIVELVRETVTFILTGSNVSFEIDEKNIIKPVDIDGDQISQVIQNIVINARQAMDEGGGLTVEIETLPEIPEGIPMVPGPCVKVAVTDQGPGIEADDLEKVFDPYFTTKSSGSGLGLAISFSIMKKHGGYISIDSKPGTGTTVSLYFKPAEGSFEEEALPEALSVRKDGRILVMDDDDLIRKALFRMLVELGFQCETVSDGNDAVGLYRDALDNENPFDIVILDLIIPGGLGGIETLKELQKIDPGVVAIASSGYANDPVMSHYREYGFHDVVAKPYRMRDIIEVLARVLNP